jgi:hypothetical protein
MSFEVTGEYAAQRTESEDLVDSGVDLFADEDEEAEDFEPKREEPDVEDDAWLYECSITAD